MNILSFDTGFDRTYITLTQDGKILSSEIIDNTDEKYHSAFLIPAIAAILKQNGMLMSEISAVGVSIGPGSFTGIRACTSVARVMAQNLNIHVIGVPSLEMVAYKASEGKATAVVMDARKGKAYIGIYSYDGQVIVEPQAVEYEKLADVISANSANVISDERMESFLKQESIKFEKLASVSDKLGANLAAIVYDKSLSSQEYPWYELKPLYIQPPPISMPKNKDAV